MSSRSAARRRVEQRLGSRQLIWFGTRGVDADPLRVLPQFAASYSIVAPLETTGALVDTSLETLTGQRVDADYYDVDRDDSPDADELHRQLLRSASAPSVVVPYRASAFLASVCFTRSETVEYAGVFHEVQRAFEHKPWVESGLRAAGLRVIPWRYLAAEDTDQLEAAIANGPQVIRTTRSIRGTGLRLIEHSTQQPAGADRFLAVSPYLTPNVPLNVNACVFPDGTVTLHGPSLQLIGIPVCTGRRFGYCGNDFARVRDLDPPLLDKLEATTVQAGRWLLAHGYVGAFGVDALAHEGQVYLAEVNPRFQGSSRLAAQLVAELDLPDLYLDHLAACLGLEAPAPTRLRDLARAQSPVAHVLCHNLSPQPVAPQRTSPLSDASVDVQLLPAPNVSVAHEGLLFRAVFPGAVTMDGQQLGAEAATMVNRLLAKHYGIPVAAAIPDEVTPGV